MGEVNCIQRPTSFIPPKLSALSKDAMKRTTHLRNFLTTFSLVLLFAIPFNASASTITPRLGGVCSVEFRWATISSTDRVGHRDLICLPNGKNLQWRAADSLKIDSQLNSILMKCGNQLRPIAAAKIDSHLLSTFRNSISSYISEQLHMQFIKLVTNYGFFNLNVAYYRNQGICSNGVGAAIFGTGPDKRIPQDAKLLWEAEVDLLNGHDKHEVSFAFARVGASWKFIGSFELSRVFN